MSGVVKPSNSAGQSRAFAFAFFLTTAPVLAAGAWGIDALLSYVSDSQLDSYLELINETEIRYVRERDTGRWDIDPVFRDYRPRYNAIRRGGLKLLAFAQENRDLGATSWGPFPSSLFSVWSEGHRLSKSFHDVVDVWELHNEPELAWWPDMPDRYASHAKALYLGLKAGAREAGAETPVLLGALGLPPGPWLERTARSGFLDYGDAWNVHYYGDASQFTGFLDGHTQAIKDLLGPNIASADRLKTRRWPVKFASSTISDLRASAAPRDNLPVWATEVGVKTVTPETWADPVRRRRQADWIIETARQALTHPHMAVFMPFVLVHRGDAYAMTESATQTWPAWEEYARFTRENPFPPRSAVRHSATQTSGLRPEAPNAVNPVILQWLADPQTASGHKLSSAYRWRAEGLPIRGELRIYNFSDEPVSGRLVHIFENGDGAKAGNSTSNIIGLEAARNRGRLRKAGEKRASIDHKLITVSPVTMRTFPVSFDLKDAANGGRREWRQFSFVEASGRRSDLGFAIERSPDLYPPQAQPLALGRWLDKTPIWRYLPNAHPALSEGPWRTINGLRVVAARQALARFELGPNPSDPEFPQMAAAYLPEGLPETGWLRVAVRELGPAGVRVRVDLVDHEGRRFTQWENLGHVRGLPLDAPRWLNLMDFHPYAWGKLDTQRRLKPSEVRQVQLRFYADRGPTMVDVELGFAMEYGHVLDPAGEIQVGGMSRAIDAPVE